MKIKISKLMQHFDQTNIPTIYINGRFYSQRITGIQRYARETLQALDLLLAQMPNPPFMLTVLAPKEVNVPEFSAIKVEQFGHFQGHLWEQIDLPFRTRSNWLFSFCPTGPLFKKNQIITIHDLAVFRIPQAFSRQFRYWYQLVYWLITRRAKITLTVSNFSANELNQCLNIPLSHIKVTNEGWQHLNQINEDKQILTKFGLTDTAFVLAVSSPTPNKNFKAIVQAMKSLGAAAPSCVAAGKADAKVFAELGDVFKTIQPLGYVSDAELKALYKHAACFIFPSFYEGFGIPPLEAMANGCPVLAADIPAVREVCGEHALYFDPHQPEQLAQQVTKIMENKELRQKLSAAGLKRAQAFTWEKGAQLNIEVISSLLSL